MKKTLITLIFLTTVCVAIQLFRFQVFTVIPSSAGRVLVGRLDRLTGQVCISFGEVGTYGNYFEHWYPLSFYHEPPARPKVAPTTNELMDFSSQSVGGSRRTNADGIDFTPLTNADGFEIVQPAPKYDENGFEIVAEPKTNGVVPPLKLRNIRSSK